HALRLSQIPRAIASVTSATQTSRIVGPALGGLLYDFGPAIVYVTVAALYLVGAALIAVIRDRQSAREREDDTPASLFSGVAFIRSRRPRLGFVALAFSAVVLGG